MTTTSSLPMGPSDTPRSAVAVLAAATTSVGAGARVEFPVRIGGTAGIVRPALGQPVAIGRVGEPDRAIRMRHQIVRRIERFAVELIGDHRHRSVMFPAHHAAKVILRGNLPPLQIERVAVGVARRLAKWRDALVVPQETILRVANHVAEHEVMALAATMPGPRPIGSRSPRDGCRHCRRGSR